MTIFTSVKPAIPKIAGRVFVGGTAQRMRPDAVMLTGRGQQYRRTSVSKSTLYVSDGGGWMQKQATRMATKEEEESNLGDSPADMSGAPVDRRDFLLLCL